MYPTLSRIARDVCAVPASSVPCERLFLAGAEIATDRHSCLGSSRFEELQIMKHTWNSSLVDHAQANSCEVEDILLQDIKELYERDEELSRDNQMGDVDDVIMV